MGERDAEAYAAKNRMAFFEVSPLCDFNIRESFSELSRMALHRNGMERLWRSNKGIDKRSIENSSRPTGIKRNSFYSAQLARTGVPRNSGSDDSLQYRPAAITQVDQVALEIIRDDDHVSATLQRQPLVEL